MDRSDWLVQTKDQGNPEPVARVPSEHANDDTQPAHDAAGKESGEHGRECSDYHIDGQASFNGPGTPNKDAGERKPARGLEPFEMWEKEEMEQLLGELRGHLGMIHDLLD
jgi:phospholipase D1/2